MYGAIKSREDEWVKLPYMGSTNYQNRGIESNITTKINTGWTKWRKLVYCYVIIEFYFKLMGHFYKTTTRVC